MTKPCLYCGDPVDLLGPFPVYRQVTGWELKANAQSSRKGGSDIVLREPLDNYACDGCVRRLRRGLPATQGGLFGGEAA